MSRVEGFQEIGSRRARAREELGRLIEGVSSVAITGAKYGDQAIAVSYTRASDREVHTREFYPEGFYDQEKVQEMLRIHQILGGQCMYEMFCEMAEIGSWEYLEGVPALHGQIHHIKMDADYIYIAMLTGNALRVIDRTTLTLVSGTPSFSGGARALEIDDDHVCLGLAAASNHFRVLRKSDWSVVSGTPTYSATVRALHRIDDMLFIGYDVYAAGHQMAPARPHMRRVSDWSSAATLPSLDGPAIMTDLDEDYLYITHYNGRCLTVLRRSDWSIVAGTPALSGTSGDRLKIDDAYLYIRTSGSSSMYVIDTRDWSLVSPETPLPAGYIDIDATRLYINSSDGLRVYRKDDWSLVRDTPPSPPTDRAILVDDRYIYTGIAAAPWFGILPKRPR